MIGHSTAPAPKPHVLAKNAQHVLLLAAHEPRIDPRLGWIEKCAKDDVIIHQLGVLHPSQPDGYVKQAPQGGWVICTPRGYCPGVLEEWQKKTANSEVAKAVWKEIAVINGILEHAHKNQPDIWLEGITGTPRLDHFKWYLNYIIDTTSTLLSDVNNIEGISAVIATDLDTLCAALLIKAAHNIPVIYDAHEYWPESDVDYLPQETAFWIQLEQALVTHADMCVTVSPPLAAFMSKQYGVQFIAMPNCEPLTPPPSSAPDVSDGKCDFLFLGGFAPGRGIELLIDIWDKTPQHCLLHLQGPNGVFKHEMYKRAQATGLCDTRIFFPESLREEQLIEAASKADVGIIPYTPISNGYRFCSPNKMSQYMAAATPILANETEFVGYTIRKAECGIVCDFSDPSQLLAAIERFAANPQERARFSSAGQSYYREQYHWEKVSEPLYAFIKARAPRCQKFIFQPNQKKPPRRKWLSLSRLAKAFYRAMAGRRETIAYRLLIGVYRRIPARIRYYLIHRAV